MLKLLLVNCLTADKVKEETRTKRNEVRPPTSVNLPSSISAQKKDEFNKPADNRRTPETIPYTAGLHSGGSYASQNRSKVSPSTAGPQTHGGRISSTTPATDSRSAVEQIIRNRSANTGGEGLPHVVDKAWTSPSVNQESTEWKTRAKQEDEKRLREKEEELRILQVILFLF